MFQKVRQLPGGPSFFCFLEIQLVRLSEFYKSVFGCKVYKVAIDAGCTCPNRDGSKGVGGCVFCSGSGSGDFASARNLSIKEQIERGKTKVLSKLAGRSGRRDGKFIAYFQNFTSTYGDEDELEEKYREALSCEGVVGIAIATRPDCIGADILGRIAKISEESFVQLELGLQTSNEVTGRLINRCYTDIDYENAVRSIKSASPKIHIVTHLIFGLPRESRGDMMESVRFVVDNCSSGGKSFHPFGLKITVLYVVRNTVLARMYENGVFSCLEKSEYYDLVSRALRILPPETVIHRLTGDPPKSILLAPSWTSDKKRVMNELKKIIEEVEGNP